MVFKTNRNLELADQDVKREKRIVARLHLEKLPFKITEDNFCSRYIEMFEDMSPLFRYRSGDYALKWCLSTEKKMKVFLLIFESNELGKEIYKENVSNRLPEYSYKTIAQIIDDGMKKGYYLQMVPRAKKQTDLKIRNIRPSEDLVTEFINWNIDLIATAATFSKKYQ
jgi:hypothetical protein